MATRPLKRSLTNKIDNDNLVIGLRSVVPADRVDLFEDEFRRFGAKRFPRALQYVANRVAADAKRLLGEANPPAGCPQVAREVSASCP